MRNTARGIVIVVLGWTSLATAADAAACDPWAAKVVSIQGVVEARHTTTDTWQAVTLNAVYCSGDSIRVAEHSRAAVVLANQTLLRLDQNSAITLTAIRPATPSLLDILTGWVHFISRVPRSLQVNTPYVNAAIEGTEFVVAVDKDQGSVTVFEGTVQASNAAGEVRITHNETAVAKAGEAPQKVLRATPRDAVQWALYYPPIFAPGDPLAPAADLLYHGRVEEARQALAPFANSADNGKAKALEAIIAVVNNDKAQALQLANEAVKLEPKVAATHIALSYAQQAQFDLDAALASAKQAVQAEPNNALAYARLAELQLSVGYLHAALDSAQHAVQLDPKQARAHTILGFAYLTQIHTSEAVQTFNTAIELDQADPLPRLGLGLAKIRQNELADGRREIEIAALLDPNNALIRSYLGKAYFEEKRPPLDADQFAMAKELDPKDPTPWFYDALRKQTENRPVEALEDLQKSIELNDNRAVYRSRLQLDQDEAARSASLARIYSNLGFNDAAQVEASKSLNFDPANHSAHRFLADIYASKQGYEIARASELLQSQLLQPVNVTPVQPSMVETTLNVLPTQGPTNIGFNEYSPLFVRNSTQMTTTLFGGNHNTKGDEIVIAGLYDRFAYSLGQYSLSTDGFRDNAHIQHDIADAFMQAQIVNGLDMQYEYRNRRTVQGDLRLDFNPNFRPSDYRTFDEETGRLGLHYKFSSSSDILLSYIQNSRDTYFYRSTPPSSVTSTIKQDADDYQAQYLYHNQVFNLVTGTSNSDLSGTSLSILSPNGIVFINTPSIPIVDQYSYYVYGTIFYGDSVSGTLGVSYDSYTSMGPTRDFDKINPKFGLNWNITTTLRLRAAGYEALKRSLTANQTLEPTQLAGFNQFFDDPNGTKIHARGVALDYIPWRNSTLGVEYFSRDLNVPSTGSGGSTVFSTNNQDSSRIYLNLALANNWIFSSEYLFEKMYKRQSIVYPSRIETTSIPIGLSYYDPTGLYTSIKTTYVKQKVDFIGTPSFDKRKEEFTLVDLAVGYRFQNRKGYLSLVVNNLIDKSFIYQDYYIYSGDSLNYNPRYIPSRSVLSRITYNF